MPPKKDSSDSNEATESDEPSLCWEFKRGEVVTDNTGKKWKLGNAIGIGGFGIIYDVAEYVSGKGAKLPTDAKYVAKLEEHSNGPLFVEINYYLRMGKLEMIEQWKKARNLKFLGVPHFVASGSHLSKGDKYRFLILPKYEKDLEAILQMRTKFNLKTVLVIASRIIDTLEYIHSHGYVHSDIKASNIMLGQSEISKSAPRAKSPVRKPAVRNPLRAKPVAKTCRHNLRPIVGQTYIDDIPYLDDVLDEHENRKNKEPGTSSKSEPSKSSKFEGDQVYLLDYGLASKYILSTGKHREFVSDQRRAHAGTLLFCSRDAHKGISSSRSDLESLAYNMVYWLTGTLPWLDDGEPESVEKKKNKFFADVRPYLESCFADCPQFLLEMFSYLSKLQFKDTPNYNFLRVLFKKAIREYGYKNDSKLDFGNLEGWGQKQKKTEKTKKKNKKENKRVLKWPSLLLHSPRKPLSSNIIFKRPKLRKKVKDKLAKNSMMNWSRILIMDPETIIKQAHQKKSSDSDNGFNILEMDLESLNPTPAMREIYNRAAEREGTSPCSSRGDELCSVDNIEGYTAEMMRVHKRMIEQRELEFEKAAQIHIAAKKKKGKKRTKRPESPVIRTSSRSAKNEVVSPSLHALKKVKSIPLKRTYSLRG